MAIYNIPSIPETADKEPVILAPDFTTTLEMYYLMYPRAIFSRPHIDDSMTRVAVTLKLGVYGLLIPRNGDPPRVTMLSNERIYGTHVCLGINRLFSQDGMKTWAASYTWPDDNAIDLDGELRRTLPLQERGRDYGQTCRFPTLMDEETGRVVHGIQGGFAVLDWR
jgi:hypothetical protein